MGSFLLKLCGSLVSGCLWGLKFSYRNKLINAQYVPGLVHKNPIFYTNIVEIKGTCNERERLISFISK